MRPLPSVGRLWAAPIPPERSSSSRWNEVIMRLSRRIDWLIGIVLVSLIAVGVVFGQRNRERDRLRTEAVEQFHKNDFEEAIAGFARSIASDPTNAEAHVSRAAAYCRHGDFERAIADCDQAIKLDP